jgi:hypothetical protein
MEGNEEEVMEEGRPSDEDLANYINILHEALGNADSKNEETKKSLETHKNALSMLASNPRKYFDDAGGDISEFAPELKSLKSRLGENTLSSYGDKGKKILDLINAEPEKRDSHLSTFLDSHDSSDDKEGYLKEILEALGMGEEEESEDPKTIKIAKIITQQKPESANKLKERLLAEKMKKGE